MASIINATTTNGVAISADNSGVLQIATNNGTTAVSIDASQIVTLTNPLRVTSGGTGSTTASGTGSVVLSANPVVTGQFGVNTAGVSNILLRNISGANYLNSYNDPITGGYPLALDASIIGFQINDVEKMRLDTSGNMLVGYTTSNGSYKLQVNSQIFATSSTIATSDANYKTNVIPLTGALALVNNLNPVSFSWKPHLVHDFDVNTPTLGFLAQEVQAVLANESYVNSVVKKSTCTITSEIKDEKGNITTPAVTEDFLGIAEGNMISILTKAIQEQQSLIVALTNRITALEILKS